MTEEFNGTLNALSHLFGINVEFLIIIETR